MGRTTIVILSVSFCWLVLSQCKKNDDGTIEIKIKAIDTVNLDGRWTGFVYTADNSTLGSFEIAMQESIDPGSSLLLTKITGSMTTPPLCKELENQGHTSVATTSLSGERDPQLHDITLRVFYTTNWFHNGTVSAGTTVGWQFVLDSLWVNEQGNQLTENAVLEGIATATENCNTQGYRVRVTKRS
ncbi:MAG: hypothetical protein QM731_05350 [Chitinophagaceae bacterium]